MQSLWQVYIFNIIYIYGYWIDKKRLNCIKKTNLGAEEETRHISRPKQVEGVLSFGPGQNS
jgi:hypothetical protein